MRKRAVLSLVGGLMLIAAAIGMLARCQAVRVPAADRLETYDTAPYEALLEACVREGLVDYAKLAAEREDDLNRFLDAVARYGPESASELFPTREHRLAYYLNAYNALMLRKWLDAGAGDGGDARTVNRLWFFYEQWKVDGQWLSLDALEQGVIRPTFDEPRIHFALVCGAMSCPPLLDEPFDGDRLGDQLDDLARRWLSEADGMQLSDGSVRLSRIFSWYADDFAPMGGPAGVLERYLDTNDPRRDAAIAAARDGRVSYLSYEWTVNAAPAPGQ